jgi:hypothetical protein
MSITIPTGDLTGILADVIPFAFPEDDYPALCCVHLEWDGETLHAMTTDHHRLAWSQWTPGDIDDQPQQDDLFTDWGSGDEPWTTNLALADAKELVKVFKLPTKEMNTPVVIDHFAPPSLTLDELQVGAKPAPPARTKVIRSRETGHSAITVVAEDNGHPFADLRATLAKNDRAKPTRNIIYNADYLADFAKVRARGPMQMTFTGPDKPTRITIGKRFIGAIMPQRPKDEDPASDSAAAPASE